MENIIKTMNIETSDIKTMNIEETNNSINPEFDILLNELTELIDKLDIRIKPIIFEYKKVDFEGPSTFYFEKYYLFYTHIIVRIPDMLCNWKFMNQEKFYSEFNIILKDYEFMMRKFINKSIIELNYREITDEYNIDDAINDFNNVGLLIKKMPLCWENSIKILNKPPLSGKLFYKVRSIILLNDMIDKNELYREISYLIQENNLRKERIYWRNNKFKWILKKYFEYKMQQENYEYINKNLINYSDIDNYSNEDKIEEILEINNNNNIKQEIYKTDWITYVDKNISKL